LVGARFEPKDWMAIIFNPSFPYRLAHTVTAFYITTGFVVCGAAAFLILKRKFVEEGRVMLSTTLWLLTVLVPLQVLLGDLHGLNTLAYQPVKLAAIEAHWNPESHAALALFAWPDEKAETNRAEITVPELGSIILTHSASGTVPGLKQFPVDERPPVAIPFFAFRTMVGLGLLMLAFVSVGLFLRTRRKLFTTDWFLRALMFATPIGFLAVLAGWTTTEVGRQPWTVYGLMRTADSVSPSLTGIDVLLSLFGYIAVYLVIFPAGIVLMARVVKKGLAEPDIESTEVEAGRPKNPALAMPET
ncbi:MAG: cytochrome ubiquinol oxidase subunit I, partial [Proteobacteria bacterium]|nr:cytochrome ubiquinol oxidase subunit I [Pseudomonadota bacterium]